jgi:wobble nucleotide-excising tRNase
MKKQVDEELSRINEELSKVHSMIGTVIMMNITKINSLNNIFRSTVFHLLLNGKPNLLRTQTNGRVRFSKGLSHLFPFLSFVCHFVCKN